MVGVEQRGTGRLQHRAGAGSWGAGDISIRWRHDGGARQTKEGTSAVGGRAQQFDADSEFGLTEMQTAFVWHYSQGGCGQTEAARRAGFSFPAMSASKLMNGRDHPNVVKAVRAEQEELRQKYAITPEKTGSMLWKIAETSFENGAYNAAVSAVKELNQLAGLTIQRSQSLNINANLDSMTKADIKSRLNELLGVSDEMKDNDL
jgi:phage terminase small subunit